MSDLVASGLDEAEARRRARLEFGGLEATKEDCRDVRGTRLVDDFAARPALRPAQPAPDSGLHARRDRLARARHRRQHRDLHARRRAHPARAARARARASWCGSTAARGPTRSGSRSARGSPSCSRAPPPASDTRFDLAQRRRGRASSKGLFASGGSSRCSACPPILGRTFTPANDRRGGGADRAVAVISYAFWQRRFGGAADVVGRSVMLNGVPVHDRRRHAAGLHRSDRRDGLSTSRCRSGSVDRCERRRPSLARRPLDLVARHHRAARARPDRRPAATQALRGVQPQIREATLPPTGAEAPGEVPARAASRWSPRHRPLRDPRPLRAAAVTIMVVVALVLLIACANIANLMLARANARAPRARRRAWRSARRAAAWRVSC